MRFDRARIGMIAAICLGEGSLFMMPFLVGSMTVLFRISPGEAGLVMALQMTTMAVTSLLISVQLQRVTLRTVGIAAGMLALASHGLAASATNWSLFLTTRVLVGMAEGLALATANAAAGRTRDPHSAFAVLTFSMSGMGVIFYASIPWMTGYFGSRAVLVMLVALALLALPMMFWLPRERCALMKPHFGTSIWKSLSPQRVSAVIAFLVFYVSINGLWSYTERIGTAIDLKAGAISHAYLLAAIVGLAGPYFARWSAHQWGLKKPLLFGLCVQVVGNFLIGYATGVAGFTVGAILIMLGYLFLLPFFKSAMTLLDPAGRLVAAAAGLQAAGTALGPGAAGLLLSTGGTYMEVVYATAVCVAVATGLIAFSMLGQTQIRAVPASPI
jgi:MFS transporter, DHA1 family, inner membrane transport protein